ncbi:hypothetical protein Tco_0987916 [Tanacetum coccineum]
MNSNRTQWARNLMALDTLIDVSVKQYQGLRAQGVVVPNFKSGATSAKWSLASEALEFSGSGLTPEF